MASDADAAFADRDAHPIVLFDGVCNLCHGTVRFLLDHDHAARFRFAPLQSEIGHALLARFDLDPKALDNVVLIDADGAHVRSDAVLRCAPLLRAPWNWFGVLTVIPRALRDAAYGFVARNRYRWFGKKDTCPMPRPEWRARFLA